MKITPKINLNISPYFNGIYEFLPDNYDTCVSVPAIIFFPGAGEVGNGDTELGKLLNTGLPALLNRNPSLKIGANPFPFLVIAAQNKVPLPTNEDTTPIVNYVLNNYKVDKNLLVVTGLSLGGGTTIQAMAANADKIVAAVTCCPFHDMDDKGRIESPQIVANKMAIRAYHNVQDTTVVYWYTEKMKKQLDAAAGGTYSKLEIYPDNIGGHDCWTKAYDPATKHNGLNVYEWMLLQSKSGAVSPPPPPPPPPVDSIFLAQQRQEEIYDVVMYTNFRTGEQVTTVTYLDGKKFSFSSLKKTV